MRSLEAHFLCVEVAMNNSSIMFDQLVKHFESHGDCVAPRAYVSTAYFQSLGDRLDRRQNGEWDVAPIGEGRNAIARLPILVENKYRESLFKKDGSGSIFYPVDLSVIFPLQSQECSHDRGPPEPGHIREMKDVMEFITVRMMGVIIQGIAELPTSRFYQNLVTLIYKLVRSRPGKALLDRGLF